MVKDILSKNVLIAGAIFGVSLCLLTLFLQLVVFPNIKIKTETKLRVVITPITDAQKTLIAMEEMDPTANPTATDVIPGVFAPGMRVVIAGTGNEGLNIRQEAGTDRTVVYLALEGETYRIVDGPQIEDGLIWWLIELTPDGQKSGWAVQDYFSPVAQ